MGQNLNPSLPPRIRGHLCDAKGSEKKRCVLRGSSSNSGRRLLARFPRPQTGRLRCDDASLWLQGVRPPPARRSHAHGAAHAAVHRRLRSVAPDSLLPRTPAPARPLPHARAAHPTDSLRRARWRAHTQRHSGFPTLSAMGRGGFHGRSGTRAARVLSLRHPHAMPTHTHGSQLHLAHLSAHHPPTLREKGMPLGASSTSYPPPLTTKLLLLLLHNQSARVTAQR